MEFIELKLNDHEFDHIRKIVYKTAGINLTESKRALVISRLARRLRQLDINSFQQYIRLLSGDDDEVLLMINRITTNLTRFYREKNQFPLLREMAVPLIMDRYRLRGVRPLRVWSAGCATGEEVYTIVFEIANAFNGHVPENLKLKVLGSDIDTNVLKKAAAGIYTEEEIAGVENGGREKYFDTLSPQLFRVKDKWRKYCDFKRINLVYDDFSFKNKIDIIFCRNVVIYFDKETRGKLYNKFHAVLNEPGFLFAGHSENLFKYNHVFKFVEKSIYRKVG